jgi:hypothetical protein
MSSDYSEESSNASATYAQIVVPSYSLEGTVVSSSTVTTGSSFIRLGSFPSLTDTSEQPSGFTNSLALANLVGSSTELAKYTDKEDAAPGALLDDNDYAGDNTCYLAGFADDTRSRSSGDDIYIDWVSVSDTTTVRKAETARLLTKGGWWDHADGNRISTTCGDKIDVVQGNYKLVVLGRQKPSSSDGNAASFDMSGGHVVDQDAAPNANVMCVEYVESEGVWTVLEDNGSGNLTSKFHGQMKELFTGTRKESYVGSSPGKYDGNLTKLPDGDDDPVIIDKTWAKRIETYVGSDGKPVPSIYSLVNAEAINEVRAATEITSTTTAALVLDTTIGVKTDVVVGLAVQIVAGIALEIDVAKYERLVKKEVVAAENTEMSAVYTQINALKSYVTDMDMDLTNTTLSIKNSVMNLREEVTSVDTNATRLSVSSEEISDSVLLMAAEIAML